MHITDTLQNQLLTFSGPAEAEQVAAVTDACREAIVDIIQRSYHDGAYHSTRDDHTLLPLANIALTVGQEAAVELDELNLCILKLALKNFGDPEHTKRKIGSIAREDGYLDNPGIERRLFLGDVASRMLTEIDPEFAAEDWAASKRRYRLLADSVEISGTDLQTPEREPQASGAEAQAA